MWACGFYGICPLRDALLSFSLRLLHHCHNYADRCGRNPRAKAFSIVRDGPLNEFFSLYHVLRLFTTKNSGKSWAAASALAQEAALEKGAAQGMLRQANCERAVTFPRKTCA